MVWIIPKDTLENMTKQLICLMTNIETGKHIFDDNCQLLEEGNELCSKPFNVYENDWFSDEYTFVKGYIKSTGHGILNTTIDNLMKQMDRFMKKEISLDLSYGYPTSQYSVARTQITKDYSRLITAHGDRNKNIQYKHHFIWITGGFNFPDFMELNVKNRFPENYEIIRSLSTIIFDEIGLFEFDSFGQKLRPGKPTWQINYPDLNQLKGSEMIINLPLKMSDKFGFSLEVIKRFNHLIPDEKNFIHNQNYYKERPIYVDGHKIFNLYEEKELTQLNLPPFNRKESIFNILQDSKYTSPTINVKPEDIKTNNITLNIILRYLSCHVCCTPLYGKFYYVMIVRNEKTIHFPICATCMHTDSAEQLLTGKTKIKNVSSNKLKMGVSKAFLTIGDVMSMIPKPVNVTMENFVKLTKTIDKLFGKTIEFEDQNYSAILYQDNEIIMTSNLTSEVINEAKTSNIPIMIVHTTNN